MQTKIIKIILVYIFLISLVGVYWAFGGAADGEIEYKEPQLSLEEIQDQLFEEMILDISSGYQPETAEGGTYKIIRPAEEVNKQEVSRQTFLSRIWERLTGKKDNVPKEDTVVSDETIKRAQENITLGERAKLLNIVRQRLDVNDVKRLLEISKAGITTAEKEEVLSLFRGKLEPEEYSFVASLYERYK